MKALTLHQPWATLTMLRTVSDLEIPGRYWKNYETRGWKTNYRGPLAIHAATVVPIYRNKHIDAVLERHELVFADLPRGVMLGTCVLADCVPVEKLLAEDKINISERAFGDYSPGRFGWLLTDQKPFDAPVKTRGYQGLWNWEQEAAK